MVLFRFYGQIALAFFASTTRFTAIRYAPVRSVVCCLSLIHISHGIHFNDRELELLKSTGTGIAHCPISNMKLSSGVARIPEMLRRGIRVGLAVDGSASNDGSNLLEEMRAAYLLHRLQASSDAPDGYEILKMATRGGAEILGRKDIGSIEIGKQADCVMIDTRKLQVVGAMEDAKSMLATVGLSLIHI